MLFGYLYEQGVDALFNITLQKPFATPRSKPHVIDLP